jgi:2-amino-4-hydroxy-6-hydroxymethyldihydropteridine diphosphokinase
MAVAYLGLGSNIGERISYIEKALAEIIKIENTKITRSSSIYETEPWGISEQEDYLNSAVEIETSLEPEVLLKKLKSIEKIIGRTESKRWSEREIDIDILFFGNEIIENEFMKVPHPQIESRKFVLIPMNEIAPDLIHPVFKKTVSELLKETKDNLKVNKFKLDKSAN